MLEATMIYNWNGIDIDSAVGSSVNNIPPGYIIPLLAGDIVKVDELLPFTVPVSGIYALFGLNRLGPLE